jgi:DeoR family transcriptional regulator, aga operon transcriptional repressor
VTDSAKGFDPAGTGAKADRHRRRNEIALLVAQKGRVTVDEISELYGISGVTARTDLDALARSGSVVRSYGGAISVESHHHNGSSQISLPILEPSDERMRLAGAAIALLGPLETIMLCSGPAADEMAKVLNRDSQQSVIVITYSLQIASYLSETPQVSLVMLGGLYRQPSGSFVGPHAEQMMKSLHAGHCFLNPRGLSLDSGITGDDIMEAHLNRQMIDAASQVTLLAELRSFGRRSLASIAEIEEIDRVICDSEASAGDVAALRARGIEVVLV